VVAGIRRFQRFLIASHRNPDGDSLGAQLALRRILSALGKESLIVAADPVPRHYRFLPDWRAIRLLKRPRPDSKFDCLIVLDSSSYPRTGLESWNKPLINVDHHADNTRFGTLNWVEAHSSCCCELIFSLFRKLRIPGDSVLAEQLYVGLLTDTGGFRFSNTSRQVFSMAADLLGLGVDGYRVTRSIYNTSTLAKMRLRGRILSEASLQCDDKVCLLEMEPKLPEKYGASPEDTEGISDETLAIAGVEVGVFARPNDNQTKFNLRSAGRVNVGAIARLFGGGGHQEAAGCTLNMSGAEAGFKLATELEKAILEAANPKTMSRRSKKANLPRRRLPSQ